jgi:pimeloyl-ACP methyl ester carboxylesterase
MHRPPILAPRLAAALLLSAACATPSTIAHARTPTAAWHAVDCSSFKLENVADGVTCGYVTVPRRHREPDGATIELATVIIPAADPVSAEDPLFIAQGGPGGSTIATFAAILIEETSLRPVRNRDLVLWDQRGTLWSKPALMCPEVDAASLANSLADASVDESAEDRAVAACGMRLRQDLGDLSDFNTRENADDVESLRVALGYETLNFYGVSYGTELGQYLMRQHPASLRSVILDAVVPTGFNLVTEVAYAKQRIAEKYFEGCAQQLACASDYPGLAGRFLELLDRLDRDPAIVTVQDPDAQDGLTYRVRMTGSDLGDLLYQAVYSRDFQAVVPLLVDRAARGDVEFLARTLLPAVLFDHTFALGMQIAVICAERGDTTLGQDLYAGINRRIAAEERESAESMLAACRQWGIELLPRTVLEPVVSEVPTLLLSGTFDPITPPAFASRVAETLRHHVDVVFPGGTHGQAFTDTCANGMVAQFVDAPATSPDEACTHVVPANYVVASDLIGVPALRMLKTARDAAAVERTLAAIGPLALGLLLLASAVLVYPAGWSIARLSGSHVRRHGLDRLAPWLAILAFLTLGGFVVLLASAVADAVAVSPALVYLAAIPRQYLWIYGFALAGVLVTIAMAAAMAGVLRAHTRSGPGRVYYVLLLVAAVASCFGLARAGLLWPAPFA